jgi:DNA-binding GntR family transcriptional regulator
MNDAAMMHALYTLADYSVLAELASKRTQASQLDGRACRAIYDAALPSIDWQAVSDHEREFMRRLGVVNAALRGLPPKTTAMMDELFQQHHEILKGLADSDADKDA